MSSIDPTNADYRLLKGFGIASMDVWRAAGLLGYVAASGDQ